ncbi:hypothetical protein [Kineococcus mangrovi]|uniref:hypothetical protein n=1 Tax=Kineococcus mangrovi TaxID=1660183 RepID=UPI003D7DCD57
MSDVRRPVRHPRYRVAVVAHPRSAPDPALVRLRTGAAPAGAVPGVDAVPVERPGRAAVRELDGRRVLVGG